MQTSDSIDQILPALFEAHSKFPALIRGGKNDFLKAKFVKLGDLMAAVQPVLTELKLLVTQEVGVPYQAGSGVTFIDKGLTAEVAYFSVPVTTRVYHVPSGQWIENVSGGLFADEKGISSTQAEGKGITYVRRYALMSLFFLETDEDDDAQPGAKQAQQRLPPASPAAQKAVGEFVAKWKALFTSEDAARDRLAALLGDAGLEWGDADAAWLESTYSAEAIRLAAVREQELEQELAKIAGGDDGDDDEPKP